MPFASSVGLLTAIPPHRGVHFAGDNWQARTKRSGKELSLGLYSTPEEAGMAYDIDRLLQKGGKAQRLNFPLLRHHYKQILADLADLHTPDGLLDFLAFAVAAAAEAASQVPGATAPENVGPGAACLLTPRRAIPRAPHAAHLLVHPTPGGVPGLAAAALPRPLLPAVAGMPEAAEASAHAASAKAAPAVTGAGHAQAGPALPPPPSYSKPVAEPGPTLPPTLTAVPAAAALGWLEENNGAGAAGSRPAHNCMIALLCLWPRLHTHVAGLPCLLPAAGETPHTEPSGLTWAQQRERLLAVPPLLPPASSMEAAERLELADGAAGGQHVGISSPWGAISTQWEGSPAAATCSTPAAATPDEVEAAPGWAFPRSDGASLQALPGPPTGGSSGGGGGGCSVESASSSGLGCGGRVKRRRGADAHSPGQPAFAGQVWGAVLQSDAPALQDGNRAAEAALPSKQLELAAGGGCQGAASMVAEPSSQEEEYLIID